MCTGTVSYSCTPPSMGQKTWKCCLAFSIGRWALADVTVAIQVQKCFCVGHLKPVVFVRFFGSNLKVLPVRSYAEMAKGMLTIAKVRTVIFAGDISQTACTRMCVRDVILCAGNQQTLCWHPLPQNISGSGSNHWAKSLLGDVKRHAIKVTPCYTHWCQFTFFFLFN